MYRGARVPGLPGAHGGLGRQPLEPRITLSTEKDLLLAPPPGSPALWSCFSLAREMGQVQVSNQRACGHACR